MSAGDAPRLESRWPPTIAVLCVVALNIGIRLWLPNDRDLALPWLPPTVEILLLGVLVAHDPFSDHRRSVWLRRASISLVLLLVATSLWATAVLIGHLITGAPSTESAGYLLAYGALVLIGNSVAFSLLYWQFDSGGPRARHEPGARYPDFGFPQHFNPELAPPDWSPVFYDYLYVGFTNTTAFSPTDVMPLAHWAKLTMTLQSIVSIVVLGLVIARAVNVLT